MVSANQQERSVSSKIDFLNESFNRNPYPVYKEARNNEPVVRVVLPNGQYAWIVTTYEDVAAVLNDTRFTTSHSHHAEGELPPHQAIVYRNLSSVDPSDHLRLRRLVQKAFTPRMVQGLRGRIEEITNELLDKIEAKGEMQLIDDFAFPLPINVICEMLGVPIDDQELFREWSNTIMEGFSNPAYAEKSEQTLIDFVDYLQQLVAYKRTALRDDLISELIRVEDEGDKLTEHELYAMVFVLIVAGHETTVNLIGNGVLALLEHPEQKALLQSKPELIQNAIEEILRFDGPVEVTNARRATEDMIFKGRQIKKGDMVFTALSSANRDQHTFPEPDQFDITRQVNNHLAFGKGIHYCLGAPLARLEGEIAISTLLRRLPNIRLKSNREDLEWRKGMIIRGLKEITLLL